MKGLGLLVGRTVKLTLTDGVVLEGIIRGVPREPTNYRDVWEGRMITNYTLEFEGGRRRRLPSDRVMQIDVPLSQPDTHFFDMEKTEGEYDE